MSETLTESLTTFFDTIGGKETMEKAIMLMNADDRAIGWAARLVRLNELQAGRKPTLKRKWITERIKQTQGEWRTPNQNTIRPLLKHVCKHIGPEQFMPLFQAEANDMDVILFLRDWTHYVKAAWGDEGRAQAVISPLIELFDTALQALEQDMELVVIKKDNGFIVGGHARNCECDRHKQPKEQKEKSLGRVAELLKLLMRLDDKNEKPN